MSDGLLNAIGSWMYNSWNMLLSVNFPGTDISIAVILVGAFLAVFSLRLLGNVFGFSFSVSGLSGSLSASQRGGNNSNIKVSEDRRHDSK